MTYANLPPKITDAAVQISFAADGTTTTGAYWGYCTVADVKYEFSAYASMTNDLVAAPPAVHPIGQAITQSGFELSDLLDHYYQMPYVGNDAKILASLRMMNTKLAVALLISRMYTSNEPNLSQVPALLEAHVAGIIDDLRTGLVIWYAPFGDAVQRAAAPVYDVSQGATIFPNTQAALDDPNAGSLFTMGRSPWRDELM